MITEPTARRDILNYLAEEDSWVTVYTGVVSLHGPIVKTDSGWVVDDDDNYYALHYIEGCDEKLMDDLEIRFEKDGSIMIYPRQVL